MIERKRSTRRVVHPTSGKPSRVQQQHRDECDMNFIVKRAQRGISPIFINTRAPWFGDVSTVPSDLTQAWDLIQAAEAAFSELPAALRRELGNDPRNMGELTEDQIRRFNLGKEPLASSPEADQGSGGGRPPEKSPKAPNGPVKGSKAKPVESAPLEQDSQD